MPIAWHGWIAYRLDRPPRSLFLVAHDGWTASADGAFHECARERSAHHFGIGQIGAREVSAGQIGFFQDSEVQVGPFEAGLAQVGPAQVSEVQIGPAQISLM